MEPWLLHTLYLPHHPVYRMREYRRENGEDLSKSLRPGMDTNTEFLCVIVFGHHCLRDEHRHAVK